jgi:hypothetical protein
LIIRLQPYYLHLHLSGSFTLHLLASHQLFSMTRTRSTDVTQRVDDYSELDTIPAASSLDIQLARPYPIRAMSLFNPKQDEYDVNFDDTRDHAVLRWNEMAKAASDSLSSPIDRQTVHEPRDYDMIAREIKAKASDPSFSSGMRRTLIGIQPLPRSLSNLTGSFTSVLEPQTIDVNILWGLLYLNIKVSTG